MRSLLRLHTRLTGIVALFVFVGVADTRAEPSPAAFAAMCRGEPIPLADRPGAITAGRPASSKFPWKPVAVGWQRLEDTNVTAWRRGEGPVELIAMAGTHADGEDLTITGFGGVTIGAEGERHGILLTRWAGLLNVRFDERFYRTAPGTTSLEVPLTDGKSLTFELRDQIPLIEAALTAGDAARALILFKPFRNWPQLAALHKRVWDAQTDQLATAGFAGTHYRELVQRGTKTWRELDAQGYLGERRVENAIMLAVQRRLVAGDPLAQAHARTLPIGPFISKSDAEFDRIIAEGAALLAPGQIGPVETAVRRVLAKQPVEWKSAPFAKESPSSREVTFLTAARTFDRPVGARPGALQSATEILADLVESVPRTDLESVLAREAPLAYSAAARAAEDAGWPATAAGLHLHACQVVSRRIDDLAVLAPSLRSESESDAAAARRLVGGLLLFAWPKLSPQHPETARLVQLLALGDSLCSAPAVCVLGLQPGSPEGLLAAINRVRPSDPVLAFSGYQRFSAAEKAEPVMWPRTFYAGIDPNDPEAVAWGRVNRAEAALRAATKSHFNIAELEARLARTYALRDQYGSVHREQMTEVARGQGSLNQVHPLEEVLMNASLKPAYESAKKELQNQLADGRANAESIRTEWNAVDREANSLSREIAEYRRDAPNSATVAKLEAEVSAARSQLGAAAKTAARTKRFAHVGHDRHREEPLLSLVLRQITDLEKSVLTKPDSPERLAELQWLHWWLGIQDKTVPPLPKVSQPAEILNQTFVETRFFHEIENALGQNDAITPMLAAIKNARARSLPDKREKLVQDGLLAFGLAAPLSESGELRKRLVKQK
jgi:hypothetical protein